MGEEAQNPAGIGSEIYVISKEDIGKKEPMKLEGVRIDLRTHEDEHEKGSDDKGKGWAVSLTGTLKMSEEESRRQSQFMRKIFFGEGRLPRKEKKRRMNRVLRNPRAIVGIAALMANNSTRVMDAIATWMYPEQIKRTADGFFVIALSDHAQKRAVYLCMKRITPRLVTKVYLKHKRWLEQELEHEIAEYEKRQAEAKQS